MEKKSEKADVNVEGYFFISTFNLTFWRSHHMVQRAFLVGRSVASDLDLFESVVCLTLCSIISP